MREVTAEELSLLEARRADLLEINEDRIPCLIQFVEALGLDNPELVATRANEFVPAVDGWLEEQDLSDEEYLSSLIAPIAFLIGEVFAQNYGGTWHLCENPDSRDFAKVVVGRFAALADNELAIDPGELAYEVFATDPVTPIAEVIEDAEADLKSGISEAVRALIRQGMNHALERLANAQELAPFLLTLHRDGTENTASFFSGNMPTDIAAARIEGDRLADTVRAWVVVYDNVVIAQGKRFDAVSAEAGEREKWLPYRWSQCYRPTTGTASLEMIGSPLCSHWERSEC